MYDRPPGLSPADVRDAPTPLSASTLTLTVRMCASPSAPSVHNRFVPPLTFAKAREVVIQSVRAARRFPGVETADLLGAAGRVLSGEIRAARAAPTSSR